MLISLGLAVVVLVLSLGVRGQRSSRPPLQTFDDLVDQPRYKSQSESEFFADGRAMRMPPAGTVAWGRHASQAEAGFLHDDKAMFVMQTIPVRIDREMLVRGQQIFSTYCMICHDATGSGKGITTQYGMINPTAYHADRLRTATDGYFYQVITEGKGQMAAYGHTIKPEDRWAVVAYIRVLQRAQNARIEDVPAAHRGELK